MKSRYEFLHRLYPDFLIIFFTKDRYVIGEQDFCMCNYPLDAFNFMVVDDVKMIFYDLADHNQYRKCQKLTYLKHILNTFK